MSNTDFCSHNKNQYSHHNYMPNCNAILRKYHCLLNEAEKLYKASDNIIDKEVLCSILDAIKGLKKAFELGDKGSDIESYANDMLDRIGCSNTCNKNSNLCLSIAAKADEEFEKETEYLNHALIALETALLDIKNSISARKLGYDFRNQYTVCVHDRSSDNCEYGNPCKCR